ncbi:MAG: HD-GYP domain-containing protein, partial [Burkholderiales bacterium]|nr:HD-GYP domain-containing protein [Burkholderiales bacterium]
DLVRIAESGIREVWIDTARGTDVAAPAAAAVEVAVEVAEAAPAAAPVGAPAAVVAPPEAPVALAEELTRARRIVDAGKRQVVSMFQEARLGAAVSVEAAGGLVDEIASSVLRNPGALVSLARLKTVDDYTYMHSVAVCALMVSLARTLGLDAAATREAGMAGLMHDLGKARIPVEVLNKPGRLTDAEFGVVRRHPEHGHALLVEGGGAGPGVLDVCLHHHEKVDGSGYPHRLKGADISLLAKMGAVCDVYDAITSNRPYKAGWCPAESVRRMTAWCDGHFDKAVFHAFVKSIGIYPVGSLVRLASDRLAVVTEQAGTSLLTPVVKVIYAIGSGVHLAPAVLDLAGAAGEDRIVSIESAEKWGITGLEKHWAV